MGLWYPVLFTALLCALFGSIAWFVLWLVGSVGELLKVVGALWLL